MKRFPLFPLIFIIAMAQAALTHANKTDNQNDLCTLTIANGKKYEGNCKNGEPDPHFAFLVPSGRLTEGGVYEGKSKDGKREVLGTITRSDGYKHSSINSEDKAIDVKDISEPNRGGPNKDVVKNNNQFEETKTLDSNKASPNVGAKKNSTEDTQTKQQFCLITENAVKSYKINSCSVQNILHAIASKGDNSQGYGVSGMVGVMQFEGANWVSTIVSMALGKARPIDRKALPMERSGALLTLTVSGPDCRREEEVVVETNAYIILKKKKMIGIGCAEYQKNIFTLDEPITKYIKIYNFQ